MSKKLNEYEKLRAIWYKKLEKSGFSDAEQLDGNLKVWSTRFFQTQPLEVWQAKAAYHNMAERFLNEYKFDNELEKVIWEYHANAISVRDIAITLKKLKLVRKTNRTTVWQVVSKLRETMKNMYLAGHKEKEA